MGVGVDQAGGDRAAGEVDHPRPGPPEPRGAGVRAEVYDPPAADGEAPLDPARRLDGIEDPVTQDEVGGVLCIGKLRGGDDHRPEQQKAQ